MGQIITKPAPKYNFCFLDNVVRGIGDVGFVQLHTTIQNPIDSSFRAKHIFTNAPPTKTTYHASPRSPRLRESPIILPQCSLIYSSILPLIPRKIMARIDSPRIPNSPPEPWVSPNPSWVSPNPSFYFVSEPFARPEILPRFPSRSGHFVKNQDLTSFRCLL